MKLYDMRVMFEDGKEGNIKLESNIMPENMQAGSETALQALYYHFPELPIKEVLAVSYDGISLNPETYVKCCDLINCLGKELTLFSDLNRRESIKKAIEGLQNIVKEFDLEFSR